VQGFIARWFGWVRVFFAPRSLGRHSRVYAPSAAPPVRTFEPPRAPFQAVTPVDGDAVALVRPYVIAHEQREEVRRRREERSRRRALWLAVHGVDVGPRFIHGVEMAGGALR
jgi:hypothetical protein